MVKHTNNNCFSW